jgi:hypothetical protein
MWFMFLRYDLLKLILHQILSHSVAFVEYRPTAPKLSSPILERTSPLHSRHQLHEYVLTLSEPSGQARPTILMREAELAYSFENIWFTFSLVLWLHRVWPSKRVTSLPCAFGSLSKSWCCRVHEGILVPSDSIELIKTRRTPLWHENGTSWNVQNNARKAANVYYLLCFGITKQFAIDD